MQIVDENQYRALSFVAFANSGGNRPKEAELMEWLRNPGPKPSRKGPLLNPGRPAKYRTVGGMYDSSAFDNLRKMSDDWQKMLSRLSSGMLSSNIYSILGKRELVEAEVPAEYGPDAPKEGFVEHLIRLGWAERDDQGGLGLTPLGRALLRSEDAAESDADSYDVVVLDAGNELSYPVLVQRIAEAGDAILIDPYLRVEQLLVVRNHTSISRVMVSSQLPKEDRAAMAVLVENDTDRPLELRMAERGVLHDRMVIGDNTAFTIGTSLNTIGKQHPTILTPLPEAARDGMRVHVEKWWNDAQTIAVYPPIDPEQPEGDE